MSDSPAMEGFRSVIVVVAAPSILSSSPYSVASEMTNTPSCDLSRTSISFHLSMSS